MRNLRSAKVLHFSNRRGGNNDAPVSYKFVELAGKLKLDVVKSLEALVVSGLVIQSDGDNWEARPIDVVSFPSKLSDIWN